MRVRREDKEGGHVVCALFIPFLLSSGHTFFVGDGGMLSHPLSLPLFPSYLAERRRRVLVRMRRLRQVAVGPLDILSRGIARHCEHDKERERERERDIQER